MSILSQTTQRLELNQSSRVPTLEQLSGEKLVFWQGLSAQIEVTLFNDTPSASTLIDVTNLDSINIVVRKNGPNGNILFTEEVTSFTPTTYVAWLAGTGKHAVFDISDIDTTQIVPQSGRLPVYFVITAVTNDNVPLIAGFGYGEIVDVGFIENPLASDYVTGRTPVVGGKLLTDFDMNGFRFVDSSGAGYTEEGSVPLTNGQDEIDVDFEFEKLSADGYRFDYFYIKNSGNNVPILIEQTILGFIFALPESAVAGQIFYWKVIPKIDIPTPIPSPHYGIVPQIGDQVFYKVLDRGGQVYNAESYGLIPNQSGAAAENLGIYNDLMSIIDDAGGIGTLLLPPGDCYFSAGPTIKGNGKHLMGAGRWATNIIVPNNAPFALELIEDGFSGHISNLCLTRTGTAAFGTIGLKASSYGDLVLEDVAIHNHDIGIKTNGDSLGFVLSRVYIYDITTTSLWLKDAVETFIDSCNFGRNGTVTTPTNAFVLFDGASTNDVRISKTQFLGHSSPNTCAAFKWINTGASPTGYYRLEDCNIEHVDTLFASDATAAIISTFTMYGGRVTVLGTLSRFNAATDGHLKIVGTDISFEDDTTMGPMSVSMLGCELNRGLLTISGGSWVFTGNVVRQNVVFTGAFAALEIGPNVLDNSSTPVTIDISAATGPISRIADVARAGSQPESVLPGGLKVAGQINSSGGFLQNSWTNLTPINSWVNIGTPYAPARYRKDPFGKIIIQAAIKNPGGANNTDGTFLFNALPVGSRPVTYNIIKSYTTSTGAGAVEIDTDGRIAIAVHDTDTLNYILIDTSFDTAV